MLGKSKEVESNVVPAFTTTPDRGKTIIGEKISIEGSIRGHQDLIIEGSVEGQIELEKYHLTVGPKGHVESEIRAADVTVSGELTGNIEATGKVEITKEADFKGEIKAKSISVEDGAYLKAVIELEREPREQSARDDKGIGQPFPKKEIEPISLVSEAQKGS
jgi:cytoskeletal protein CcmA (bactofilin family)